VSGFRKCGDDDTRRSLEAAQRQAAAGKSLKEKSADMRFVRAPARDDEIADLDISTAPSWRARRSRQPALVCSLR
jgi:hypothetical protein